MGTLVTDREATVLAVLRVADFESYMRNQFPSSVPPLNRIYDPCDGIHYEDGFTNDLFRAWQQHLEFAKWEMSDRYKREPIVTVDPEVLGGTPVFAETRIPVAVLFENLADGLKLDEIIDSYPSLTRDLALKALQRSQSLLNITASSPP